MTRNIVLYELMSLDGYADDPGEGEWFGDADERLVDFLGEVIATQDAVLLGRRTYEKWAPHWPTSTMQPFADFINSTQKYMFPRRSRRSIGRTPPVSTRPLLRSCPSSKRSGVETSASTAA
jgi:dihydrofolate reductase